MPRATRGALKQELDRWASLGVEGHFDAGRDDAHGGWLDYHTRFAAPLAKLVGAHRDEVVAMNTLTTNLHLMMASFYRPTPKRYKILIEQDAFPSDRYAVESQLRWHGLDPKTALVVLAPRPGSLELDRERYEALLAREGERIALVLLPGVQYLSGERLDLASYAATARHNGCTVGFDLAHSIGNVPLSLHDDGPDFAVWCHYKYLNSGPGAVAGCFVHRRHADAHELPRLAGWWGHDRKRRFRFEHSFAPMRGAEGWQVSNPPILSLAPLGASLALFESAGMRRLRAKSERLTAYLEWLIHHEIGDRTEVLTPRDPTRRGCQLSIRFKPEPKRARDFSARLRDAGVVADWREPNVLRLAPVPLYNRFRDVHATVAALRRILDA